MNDFSKNIEKDEESDFFNKEERSGNWWTRLPRGVKNTIYGVSGFVASAIALNQLNKDAPSDAEIFEWEKQHTKELIKADEDWKKELKAMGINPRFALNVNEAFEKIGKELGISKAAWDFDVKSTINFVNAEGHEKYNAIEVFIGEIKGSLETLELIDKFTSEIENELRIQLLTGSSSTVSYEKALENVEEN